MNSPFTRQLEQRLNPWVPLAEAGKRVHVQPTNDAPWFTGRARGD
jgi:hypothetical protein